MEWCPKCQKQVEIWMKASTKVKGDKLITHKERYCYECRMFLNSEDTEETMGEATNDSEK